MCPGQRKTDKEGPAFGYELLIVWREGPTEEQTVAACCARYYLWQAYLKDRYPSGSQLQWSDIQLEPSWSQGTYTGP